MSTLRSFPTLRHISRMLKKSNHYQHHKSLYHKSRRSFSSSPITNEILWRSIVSNSSKKLPPISFQDVFQRTKALSAISPKLSDVEEKLIIGAEAQRKQSPARVARVITHLNNLPYSLGKTNSIKELMDIYVDCYEKVTEIKPIETISDVDEYYKIVRYFLVRQLLAVPKLCHGLLEKSTEENNLFSIENSGEYLTAFINQFASQRLATRVMSAHNLSVYEQIKNNKSIKMGLFEENCDIIKYIKSAIIDASQDCERHFVEYGDDSASYLNFGQISFAPQVNVYDKRKNPTKWCYIPQHLHHMIFELLKNSMRAIIENNDGLLNGRKDNQIDIVVINGNDGKVTIKISDCGGGIARDTQKEKIWLYGYTSAYDNKFDNDDNENAMKQKLIKHKEALAEIINSAEEQWKYDYANYIDTDLSLMFDVSVIGAVKYTPMFGLGYGLPITKLYAQYFGGDCQIQSIHGYGTDAYLFLNNLEDCTNIII